MTQKLHITILTMMIWSFSFAQIYTHYNVKNGLPSNHVYRITQDNKGFIWFITDKGMAKFNGTKFKTFTTKEGLPTNDIWDIRITPDDKIWYFTKASKLGYVHHDTVYTFENHQKNNILYPTVISQNNNAVFFTNGSFYYLLKNHEWQEFPYQLASYSHVEKVMHPKVDKIYFKKNTDSIFILNKKERIIKKISFKYNYQLIKHRAQVNDSLFVWIYNNKIKLLNLNTLRLYTEFIERKTNLTRFSTTNNQIQFSGENYVAFLDDNYHLTFYNVPKNFNSHYSFIDKNKNLWIATFTNGVYFIPKSKRDAKFDLTTEKVGRIQKVNNQLIAGVYNKGFYQYDTINHAFKPFIKTNDFVYGSNYIKELKSTYFLADSKIFVLKNNRINKINNTANTRKIVYFNKKLYAFNATSLIEIDKEKYTIKKEFLQNGIRNILLFNNKIFLATASGIKQFSNDKFSDVTIGNNQFNKPITSLSKFNNNQLIVGTDGFGAYKTDLNKIELLEQSEYLTIQSSFIDNNNIWLATNKGVWHYKKEGNAIKLIRKYTTNDGLSLDQTNAVFTVADKLIASSNDGISIIPIHQKENNQFLNLYFDDVTYDGEKIDKQVKYSPNNHLQVSVASIDFSNNKKFVYQYQLLPIQKKWITTNSNQISFNDLPPNDYQLNIKSNNKTNSKTFNVMPLWHQTIWSKILFGIFSLIIITSALLLIRKKEIDRHTKKLNTQKQLADFELHALRSQMNPHFVFNSLNAIQYLITKNEIDLSEKYLVKFSKLIRMFFDFSRTKEITLQEEIALLKGYLEIEKMRFGNDFKYQFNIDKQLNINAVKIPTMLLQPIVENAVNHGIFHHKGKGLISLSFNYINQNTYKISIIDDGIGIQKSQKIQQQSFKKHHSKSSDVFKERIKLLNQSKHWHINYQIIDNNGTEVHLTFTKND